MPPYYGTFMDDVPMVSAPLPTDQNPPRESQETVVSASAIVILAAGMVAAWLAAGSTGLLANGLRHGLTWFALTVALVVAWPRDNRSLGTWTVLIVSVVFGLLMTLPTLTAVNVFAVVVVLAAIAQFTRGLTSRVALIASLAAGALALSRLACDSIPFYWMAADVEEWLLGRLVGWIVGSPLEVGATFGGLDFLILMTAIYAAWLISTPPPRRQRAIWAAIAIAVGHLVYLAVLANSEKMLAALPDMVLPPESDSNHIGLWTWSNGLRMLLPWNVPLLAVMLNTIIAAVMFRGAQWLPVIEPDEKELKEQKEKEAKEDVPGSVLAADMLFRFGPVLLAVVGTVLVAWTTNKSDLRGKTIVAYEQGYLNWLKPEYDSQVDGFYGMLPVFVESLGGKFATSKGLSEQDLESADVLVLLHPDEPWSDDVLQRIWGYVERGGSLLVVADPVVCEGKSKSSFNSVLQPTAMRVRQDTAVTRSGNWEQSYQIFAHPATAGLDDLRNRFGIELGSSIQTRWPARPVLVGRWGWSDPGSDAALTGVSHYNAGELLGDLVLAAEQPIGRGRVFVLGSTSPLRNEMLANSYPFVGRLLGYLAHRPSNPQNVWRQLLGLLALAAMAALVACRPTVWQVILTATVLSLSLVCCTAAGYWSGRVLPDGRIHESIARNNVAYIDDAHLGAYSNDLWTNRGISGLLRTLMRHGYLPLLAPDLTDERLERAGLLISIAPARALSGDERNAVKKFVANGRTFICMVGAEDTQPVAPLLADFAFTVPPSPVPPGKKASEPKPLGAFRQLFGKTDKDCYIQFHAAWPLECVASNPQTWVEWSDGKNDHPVVISHTDRGGSVVMISDTHFACNENLETNDHSISDSVGFWRWLLSRVIPGQKPWNPPPKTDGDTLDETMETR